MVIHSLPKPHSLEFREFWQKYLDAFPVGCSILFFDGIIPRNTMDFLLQKKIGRIGVNFARRPRHEILGLLAGMFHQDKVFAHQVCKELDKNTQHEKELIEQLPEDTTLERLWQFPALAFHRDRARFWWVTVRDDREAFFLFAHKLGQTVIQTAEDGLDFHNLLTDSESTKQSREQPNNTYDTKQEHLTESANIREKLNQYEKLIKEQSEHVRHTAAKLDASETERSQLLTRLAAREKELKQTIDMQRSLEMNIQKQSDINTQLQQQLMLPHAQQNFILQELLENERSKNIHLQRKLDYAEAATKKQSLSSEHIMIVKSLERTIQDLTLQLHTAHELVVSQKTEYIKRQKELKESLFQTKNLLQQKNREHPKNLPPSESCALFIDASNISASVRSLSQHFEHRILYSKLKEYLLQGRTASINIIYIVHGKQEKKRQESSFTLSLRAQGFDVREKRVKQFIDGNTKGDWDMGITIDMIDFLPRYHTAILCSGDGDFIPLLRYLQKKQRRIEVASFPHDTDPLLQQNADLYWPLDITFCERL